MRLIEFANAEEQLALWKLINDNVWSAIHAQAQEQAKQRAEQEYKKKKGKRASKGGYVAVAPTPVKLPPPKPPTLANKPTTTAVVASNPAQQNTDSNVNPKANAQEPDNAKPTPSANIDNVATQTANVDTHLQAPSVAPQANNAQQRLQKIALQRQNQGVSTVKRV
jgi:hypothetical protein